MDDIFSARNEWFAECGLIRNLGDKTVLLRCDPTAAPAVAAAASGLPASEDLCRRAKRQVGRRIEGEPFVWRRRMLVCRVNGPGGGWWYVGAVGMAVVWAAQRVEIFPRLPISWKKDLM